MKRTVRLTESDLTRLVRRVIKEQILGGLEVMPELGYSVDTGVGYAPQIGCKTYKSSGELSLELFGKLRGISGQPNQLDKTIQLWILRLHNSMTGVGGI